MGEATRTRLSPDNPWPGLDPFDETTGILPRPGGGVGRAAASGPPRVADGAVRAFRAGQDLAAEGRAVPAAARGGLPRSTCASTMARARPALREQVFARLQAACANGDRGPALPRGEPLVVLPPARRRILERAQPPGDPGVRLRPVRGGLHARPGDEASQARSAAFLAELGDLVENRPPKRSERRWRPSPHARRVRLQALDGQAGAELPRRFPGRDGRAQGADALPHVQPLSPAGDERRPGLRRDHLRGRAPGRRRRRAADHPAPPGGRAQPRPTRASSRRSRSIRRCSAWSAAS